MGEYTESEMKVVVKIVNEMLRGHIDDLGRTIVDMEQRIIALERALIHVQHLNTDDGSRHQNDGGWFD